jgi:superfamily II DNA or RNA helicase
MERAMNPRKYQQTAIDAILERFSAGDQRTLCVVPTGGGKTIIASHVALALMPQGRVMVLAHRNELIRQAVDKFTLVTGITPEVEMGDERTDECSAFGKAQIVVSSFQSQYSGRGEIKRMQKFDPNDFAFLWIDEAHHLPAEKFRSVLDYYAQNPKLKILGVTATPHRADEEHLGEIFQSVAFEYTLPEIVADGYLVPIHQYSVVIEGLDFSQCKTTAGDLNAGDLEAAMISEKPLHGVVHATIEFACGLEKNALAPLKDDEQRAEKLAAMLEGKRRKKTLIFNVSVDHAKRTAEILNRWIPGSARSVDGETPKEIRKETLRAYAEGEFQFLVNCGIATEGFDEPGIEIVVMGRPTKSQALYIQMCGRGTRPANSIARMLGECPDGESRRAMIASSEKPCMIVIDFVGNSGRHKLINSADILGATYDEAVVERAKELMLDREMDTAAALDEASIEIDEERAIQAARDEDAYQQLLADAETQRQLEVARRNGLVGVTSYHVSSVDAMDPHAHSPQINAVMRGGATDKQVDLLVKLGVQRATAAGYGVRQASAVIESLKAKRCTTKQAGFLRYLGYSAAEVATMNYDAASRAIESARAKNA